MKVKQRAVFAFLLLLIELFPSISRASIRIPLVSPKVLATQFDKPACVTINQVHIKGVSQINKISPMQITRWKQLIEGKCISNNTLVDYAEYVGSELKQAGYLTSYLFYPEQNFSFGVLQSEVVSGRLSSVSYQDESGSHQSLANAFPLSREQAFNLRHIEQGLYNLQNTSLIPHQLYLIQDNHKENNLHLVVKRESQWKFKGILSFESQVSTQQAIHEVNNAIFLGNPFRLNDFLFIDINSDFGINQNRELRSAAIFYSLPYQYWLFSAYGRYQKSLNTHTENYVDLSMKQRSRVLRIKAEHIFSRTPNSLTSLAVGSQIQVVDTFLSHHRLMTQRRLANYIMMGLVYQRDLPQGHMTLGINYKQSTSWFGANAHQITGLDKANIYQLSAEVLNYLQWGSQPLYLQHQMALQLSRSNLDHLLEKSTVAGKAGVSGFSNEKDISSVGDNSLMLKNELGWFTPWQGFKLYSSLDLGTVSNNRASFWKKNMRVGAKLGARGGWRGFNYHLFIEAPIWQMTGSKSRQPNSGIKLSLDY